MKKFLFSTLILIFCIVLRANAEVIPHSIYAVSQDEISSADLKEGTIIKLKAIDNYSISKDEIIEKNSEIMVRIVQYSQPKRGKRNGYLKVNLISYEIPSKNEKRMPKEELMGTLRLSTPKDLKSIAESAGVTIAGHFLKVPGFSQAIAVSKGLLEPNENQSRIKSAGENLYKSTPLVYIEKGKELNIEKDTIVVIKVKSQNE